MVLGAACLGGNMLASNALLDGAGKALTSARYAIDPFLNITNSSKDASKVGNEFSLQNSQRNETATRESQGQHRNRVQAIAQKQTQRRPLAAKSSPNSFALLNFYRRAARAARVLT